MDRTLNLRSNARDIALLGPGESYTNTETVGKGNQADWYQFPLEEVGSSVSVEMLFSHSNEDLNLRLDDAQGGWIDSSTSVTDNENIEEELDAGTYYLKAYPWGGSEEYDLTIDVGSNGYGKGAVDPEDLLVSASEVEEGQELLNADFEDSVLRDTHTYESVSESIEYVDGNQIVEETSQFEWVSIPYDQENYNEVTGEVTDEVVSGASESTDTSDNLANARDIGTLALKENYSNTEIDGFFDFIDLNYGPEGLDIPNLTSENVDARPPCHMHPQ